MQIMRLFPKLDFDNFTEKNNAECNVITILKDLGYKCVYFKTDTTTVYAELRGGELTLSVKPLKCAEYINISLG